MKSCYRKRIISGSVFFIFWFGLILYALYFSATAAPIKGFDYRLPFAAGSLFLAFGSFWVYWRTVVKKTELYKLYIVMSFVVLSLLLWTQTPLHHHDNQFHYDSTYVLSNMIMGHDTQVGIWGGRVEEYERRGCDVFRQYAAFENFPQAYADMQENMFAKPFSDNSDMVRMEPYLRFVSEPLYFYLPQALGFCLARILNLNVHWLLYLGRAFVAITCVWITGRAIRNTPVYKEIFLVCGLIPTTILSYVTVSRDALILAFSFYFISKCFQMLYEDKKHNFWDYLFWISSILLLAPYKFVYIPLIVLFGFFVIKNGRLGKPDVKKIALIIAAVLGILLFFCVINYDYILKYLTGANKSSLGQGGPFTIPYMLSNPVRTAAVVVRTILLSTIRYAANMIAIGDYGGGIHKEMVLVEAVFIMIIILWTNRKSENDFLLPAAERIIIVLGWLLVSAMIYLAYLTLTPVTNDVIIGIQGRYFTPVLPLMLISFCSFKGIKNIENKTWTGITEVFNTEETRSLVYLGIYGLALVVAVNMYVWVIAFI